MIGAFSLPVMADDVWINVSHPAVQISAGHSDSYGRPGYCYPVPVPPHNKHDKKAWKRYKKERKAYEKYMKERRKAMKRHGRKPAPCSHRHHR